MKIFNFNIGKQVIFIIYNIYYILLIFIIIMNNKDSQFFLDNQSLLFPNEDMFSTFLNMEPEKQQVLLWYLNSK